MAVNSSRFAKRNSAVSGNNEIPGSQRSKLDAGSYHATVPALKLLHLEPDVIDDPGEQVSRSVEKPVWGVAGSLT